MYMYIDVDIYIHREREICIERSYRSSMCTIYMYIRNVHTQTHTHTHTHTHSDVDALLEARELVIECNALEGVRQRAAYHRDLVCNFFLFFFV